MALTGLKKKPEASPAGPDYSAHLGATHVAKPITGMVSVEHSTKGDKTPVPSETTTEHKGVMFNKKNSGMSIMVEGGRTMNMGNYESVKITVGITVPCDPDTLNEAYDYATDWIGDKINEAVKAAKGE